MIGTTIGPYKITDRLGQGGMATVYKALDTRLNREVAIKFLRTERLESDKALARFELEAKALAQLKHPHIVEIYDYGEHEGAPYLVMDYLPGGTLKQMLGKLLSWQKAATLLAPIAQALAYAHKRNIVHRDVKPSNILLSEDRKPFLGDFGIAKILDLDVTVDLTGAGIGLGTPEYMAPEQSLGKGMDHRADIYALGVILYELVTGKKPFEGDTPMAVMMKHMEEDVARPTRFVSGIPRYVERVILKAMAKEQRERFSDMAEFAGILERMAEGEVVDVGRGSVIRRRTVKRLVPWLAGAAGLIIISIAGYLLSRTIALSDPEQAMAIVRQSTETAQANMHTTMAQEGLFSEMTQTQLELEAATQEWINHQTQTVVALTPSPTPTMTSTPVPTNTPTPTSTPFGRLYFNDFEDDDLTGIELFGGWEDNFEIVNDTGNNVLKLDSKDMASRLWIIAGGDSSQWENYSFQFDLKYVSQVYNKYSGFQVFLRGSSDSNYEQITGYWISCEASNKGTIASSGIEKVFGAINFSCKLMQNDWNTFRVEIYGNQIYVDANGSQVAYVQDIVDMLSPLVHQDKLLESGMPGVSYFGYRRVIFIDNIEIKTSD